MTLYNLCNYAIYYMMIFRILIWFTVVFEYSYKKYAVRSQTYSPAFNKINIVKENLLIWMEKDLKCSRNAWDSEKWKLNKLRNHYAFLRINFDDFWNMFSILDENCFCFKWVSMYVNKLTYFQKLRKNLHM